MPKRKERGALPLAVPTALPSQQRVAVDVQPTQKGPLYPPGVSKTASGKFQARIKLNGKRYDLGSNFNKVEEAAAAYAAAKLTGHTEKPSPKHTRIQRGLGTQPAQ